MNYYVYKTINKVNGKFYIGVHSSKKIHDQSYLGSGIALNRAIKKYGRENFINEVLSYHLSHDLAYAAEKELVTQDVINDSLCYNLALGGRGPKDRPDLSDFNRSDRNPSKKLENRKKASDRLKLRVGDKNHNFGKPRADETKKLISKNRTGKLLGVPKSEETKRKMAEARSLYWKKRKELTYAS